MSLKTGQLILFVPSPALHMSRYIDSENAVRPQDIRWQTVKTEEEEYLDKLREPSDPPSSHIPFTYVRL